MGSINLSTGRAAIIVCVWIAITVAVGLMAGLINKGCPEDEVEGGATTTLPLTTPTSSEPTTTEEPGPWLDPFLRETIRPKHYSLYFYPDFYFNGTTFYGNESVTIAMGETTRYVIIHIKDMTITHTALTTTDDTDIPISRAFPYSDNQYWVVEAEEAIEGGTDVLLHLDFQGSLDNGIVGYYKSSYTNSITKKDSWLATTKFQPTDARKAYPCFDEPKFKANFTITQKHWTNFTALSNMPEDETKELEPGWSETKFKTTPIMSSYLVCFIVCDFSYTENTLDHNGITHRVWSSPDKINQTLYALDFGKGAMDYLAGELDMDFHLPKIDHVAVPDYPSGATEHWGLVTYRESRLLYDPDTVGDYDKQRVAAIIAHEVAHHYFGNAVTCKWWDDIWLNEGFANFYENKALVAGEAYFGGLDHFLITTQQGVMRSDAIQTSRPVVKEVNTPNEINAAFSGIVYNKGASLIRMMEHFVGEEIFRNGIREFLKTHEYDVMTTPDLWAAIQRAVTDAGVDLGIAEVMNPWTYQMGLPVVHIDYDDSNNQFTARPIRFLTDPDANIDEPEEPEYKYQWYIPLSYETSDNVIGIKWMNKSDLTFEHPSPTADWIKFNVRQFGFYRVNYTEEMWTALSNQLETDHVKFSEADRSQIIDDAFNLARATQLEYPTALDMTQYLKDEKHYFPWSSTRYGLSYISDMMYFNQDYGLWREYIRDISGPIMEELGVDDGGEHLDILNRINNIIPLTCGHGYQSCLDNCTEMFLDWVEDEDLSAIRPNLRRNVYGYGMSEAGTDEAWNTMWDRYLIETSGQERNNFMYALAQTKRLWLIQRYLDYSMDPDLIRDQDFFTVVQYMAGNPIANSYVFNWVKAHYDALIERFGIGNRYLGWLVPNIVTDYNTDYQLQMVKEFYNSTEAGPGEAARLESIAIIESNIAWVEKNVDPIVSWLKSRSTP